MPLAILKLSYNNIGDTQIEGGICGTAFFVDNKQALTACHVLNSSSFKPNENYSRYQYWLISRQGNIIPIQKECLEYHPELDTTVIRFDKPQPVIKTYKLSNIPVKQYESVACKGYIGDSMPLLKTAWAKDRLIIENANLKNVISDMTGVISAVKLLNVKSSDMNLNNIKGILLSFLGVVGMSGGPLITMSTGESVGLMSIGLPPDSKVKTTLLAISSEEINKILTPLSQSSGILRA